jgi:hypothetical protein
MFKGWQGQATSDVTTITNWLDKFPDANWATRTGPESGVWVLDVDGMAGQESLYFGFGERGQQIETLGVRTSPDHYQLYFQYPTDIKIGNSVGKLGRGLDVRGAGGYVLIPPSVHPDGRAYEWLEAKPIALTPDWLLELVTAKGIAA